MTTLGEDLRTLILTSTGVTSRVGSRVHYNHIPQDSTIPHVWLRTASDRQLFTMDRVAGLHEANVDLECVGLTESTAQALADAVLAKIDGFKGTMGNVSARGIFVESKDDSYDPKSINSDYGLHVVSYDVHLWYST